MVIAAAQLMVVLDGTIVNVALPHIQTALHFSGTNLEWVVNAYTLAFGGLLLLGGRSGDLLGRQRILMAGIALFALASLAGGLATGQAWLLTARVIQGIGGALAAPASLSLIAITFPQGRERNRAMGVYAAVSIAGAAIGLIAGGLLTSYAGWRWVFFVNVPIGLVLVLLVPRGTRAGMWLSCWSARSSVILSGAAARVLRGRRSRSRSGPGTAPSGSRLPTAPGRARRSCVLRAAMRKAAGGFSSLRASRRGGGRGGAAGGW
jgi:MFS family permease